MQRIQRSMGIARSVLDRRPAPLTASAVRAAVLEAGIAAVISATGSHALNALEIGTMFGEAEGLSTLRIARALDGGSFVSVDISAEAIANCTRILAKHGPHLVHRVTFVEGASPEVIPEALARTGALDFALLDGVAQPEPNLREFELVLPHLREDGLLLIDDGQDVPPGPLYGGPRPFGKASPIVPFLVLAEHWRYRQAHFGESEPPETLAQAAALSLVQALTPYDWHLIGTSKHRMLALARPTVMARLISRIPAGLAIDPCHPRPR